MKKPGRPTFKILPDRLKALRKRAGLTQQAVADGVVARQGTGTAPEGRLTTYQRIESHGKTSGGYARHLADLLAEVLCQDPTTTLDYLCGGAPEAPPDRTRELEAHLRAQLAEGNNERLQRTLEHYGEYEDAVSSLAGDLATRLEIAHLEQRQDELEHLERLTGWPLEELLRPSSSHGYWLLISHHPGGHRETEIFLGVNEVVSRIEAQGSEWLDALRLSDAHVELIQEELWTRVQLKHPQGPRRLRAFSFVRCAPSATGLQWVKPSCWDLFWIQRLESWASCHANFVTGFKSETTPADLENLRLVVARYTAPENPTEQDSDVRDRFTTLAVLNGSFDHLLPNVVESIARNGLVHELRTNALSDKLWETLEPYLAEKPANWWRIKAGVNGIELELRFNLRDALPYGLKQRDGLQYLVYLAQVQTSGELRQAPWRTKSVAQVIDQRLTRPLKDWQEESLVNPPPSRPLLASEG